ncbi:MAG: SMP-30/gluconolactonase/LRE family protein [Planctomycetota bacterium]|nr:SMP-30/gluconolactonase/LRE family protein [Planctomycetota bacterium]
MKYAACLLPLLLLGSCVASAPAHRDPVLDGLEVVKLAGEMGFTEGPVWLPEEGALVFSDIPNARLMRWSEADGLGVYREAANPNGNLLDLDGRLLTCQHGDRNLVREEADGSLSVLAERYEGQRLNSPNDVAVQSDGTLWFTDPPWGLENLSVGKELAGNWVYRLRPETGELVAVIQDLVLPNGIALSPDQSVLYVADTGGNPWLPDPAQHDEPAILSAYAIDADHELSEAPLWRVETVCDGMCIDEFGNIYATGESVSVWRPDGTPVGTIAVPEQPANVCFGGANGDTLFITARTSLYAVRLDVRGNTTRDAR